MLMLKKFYGTIVFASSLEPTCDTSCIVLTSTQLGVTSLAARVAPSDLSWCLVYQVQHIVIMITCFRMISVVNNILRGSRRVRLGSRELQRWCQPKMDCCKEMLHPFAFLKTVFSWTLLCIQHLIFLFYSTSNLLKQTANRKKPFCLVQLTDMIQVFKYVLLYRQKDVYEDGQIYRQKLDPVQTLGAKQDTLSEIDIFQ